MKLILPNPYTIHEPTPFLYREATYPMSFHIRKYGGFESLKERLYYGEYGGLTYEVFEE